MACDETVQTKKKESDERTNEDSQNQKKEETLSECSNTAQRLGVSSPVFQ